MEQIQGTIRNITPVREEDGILKRIRRAFTREAKEKTVYDLKIAFHRAAAGERVHGQLLVSCKERGIINRPINFMFEGVQVAPLMTPDVIYHIWNEAIEQGYIPHSIFSYKGISK